MCLAILIPIGSIVFGPFTDRYGRKKGIVISLLGLTIGMFNLSMVYRIGSVFCFMTKKINEYLIFRVITGLFDNMINLGQAYMADITSVRERPRHLAQFESMVNLTQCVGPLIAGVLSKISLYLPLYFHLI